MQQPVRVTSWRLRVFLFFWFCVFFVCCRVCVHGCVCVCCRFWKFATGYIIPGEHGGLLCMDVKCCCIGIGIAFAQPSHFGFGILEFRGNGSMSTGDSNRMRRVTENRNNKTMVTSSNFKFLFFFFFSKPHKFSGSNYQIRFFTFNRY